MSLASPFSRLMKNFRNLFSPSISTAQPNSAVSYRPMHSDLLQSKETLERLLIENILSFWYPQVIDSKEGGFRLNHDIQGKWKGPANKHLVTQARTLWFFSRLAKTEHGKNEHLEAARHGYEFLSDRMWDNEFGGFYWEVDSSGNIVTKPDKHLYGQAFGLYALSQYAMASGDSSATALVEELFSILEHHAHDSQYGGYREFFWRDWSQPSADVKGYMNTAPNIKQLNTHIHLMEAITPYYELTKDRVAQERLIELLFIQSNAVVVRTDGDCTYAYQINWTPLQGTAHDRINYGHDLENVWMLIEACDTAGVPNSPLLDLYRTLFNYSLRYGFDLTNGGFYLAGRFNMPADSREKIWWIQAEGLICALQMYCLTGDEIYLNCFSQTLDWIVKHQVDWENGEWYAQIDENGSPSGDKAGNKSGAWKSPYHNGRAMIRCLELLQLLTEEKAPSIGSL